MKNVLPFSFYLQEDVVEISRALIGKMLFTNFDGEITGGMIVETEGYKGPEDRASHAYNNRFTERTKVMFENGGIAYIYLCYGIHNLLNVVTNKKGIPHAVLIRALEPKVGIKTMLERRNKKDLDFTLTRGPGSVAEAMGLNRTHNGISFLGPKIWIEKGGKEKFKICSSRRIGVEYALLDAKLPWRFYLKGNPFVSRNRSKD